MPDFEELPLYVAGDSDTQLEIQVCYVTIKALQEHTMTPANCSQYEYELMAELYDGAIGEQTGHWDICGILGEPRRSS